MKKRIISVLCLLLMACMLLTACGGSKSSGPQDLSNSKYVGNWVAVSMSIKDTTEPYQDECYLTLNPDGTAVFYAGDSEESESASCNWEETSKGIKLTGDSKMEFTADGDTLATKIMGVTLLFERQP